MDDSDRLSALRAELADRLGRRRFDLWIGPQTTIELSSEGVRVGCPSRFEEQWLRRRLHPHLVECCRTVAPDQQAIEYYIRGDADGSSLTVPEQIQQHLFETDPVIRSAKKRSSPQRLATTSAGAKPSAAPPTTTNGTIPALEPLPSGVGRPTFANFVNGPCNELALQTARTVVSQLGHFGPLLFYGPAGVGKTHLLLAMLHQLRQSAPLARSLRLTAEQFTGGFLEALNERKLPGFRHKFRSLDLLVIDDIQFLQGKKATLEELVTTMDTLQERGKQVVLTANCSPGDLQKLSLALVTKLSGGLAIPLDLPDFSTRLALVRQFLPDIHADGTPLNSAGLAETLATQVRGSARQLQGAVNRLLITSKALARPLSVPLAREVLSEFVQQTTVPVRLADIQRAVCEVCGVEAAQLKSPRKNREIAQPRMLAMWLACKLTRAGLGEISEFFGRRSHTTVISAQRRIEQMVSRGETVALAHRECPIQEAIRKIETALRTG